ncbi:hypothetical protein L7F22_040193 [Adiantum nelumboides]|nr:hypothetical protein [Adiantum nelumboides]
MVSTGQTEAKIRYSLQEEEEAMEIEVAVEDNQEQATTMTTMTTKQATTMINHQEEEAEDKQEGEEAGLEEEPTTIPVCAMYAASQDTMPTIAINGIEVKFNLNGCFIQDPKNGYKWIANGKKEGRMFTLDVGQESRHKAMYVTNNSRRIGDLNLWHKQCGHINIQRLKDMEKRQVVRGLPHFSLRMLHEMCEACQLGNHSQSNYVSNGLLDLVHTDVWGPTREASLAGNRYFVTFIDDYSRKVWLSCIKQKSDVFAVFQNFKACVEKESGQYIKTLRSYGGGEYFSHEFINFLSEHGIRRQTTCKYTPQQNGVAERKNGYIAEVARSMLNEMHVPLFYWADAVITATYIMNRCPIAGIHEKTPEVVWSGRKPDLSYLKIFGCICYMHVPWELRGKMDARAEKCIFIGYSLEKKGYRCYNPNTKHL